MKNTLNYNIGSIIITCLLIALMSCTYGQIGRTKKFAVVDVVLDDTALLHGISLEFQMCEKGINTVASGYTVTYNKTLISKKTRVIIPLSTSVNYGRIKLVSDIELLDNYHPFNKPLDQDNNLFLFQNGDSVTLHLSVHHKGASFTGKSAGKFNCMYKIGCNMQINSFSESNKYDKLKNYEAALTVKKRQADSLYILQLTILNKYKNKLNGEVYNLIRLDCWGNYKQNVVENYLNAVFMMKKQAYYKVAKDLFLQDYNNYKERPVVNPALLVKSYKYCDFLTEKEKAYAVIINSTPEKNYYSDLKFGDINKAIDLHYRKGILKDKVKMLAFLNLDRRRQADFVDYLSKAINEAGDNEFRKAIIAFKDASAPGVNAFPFELTNKHGQVVKLSDFKGKIVIMDFWFTGCHGCLMMAEKLKPIVEAHKTDPHIVFLTVSIDRDKNVWQKSTDEGKYCSTDEINLIADADKRSAIIKHYNIDSFPTLIAISKEGKIISVAPPDPRINVKAFTDFIDLNL